MFITRNHRNRGFIVVNGRAMRTMLMLTALIAGMGCSGPDAQVAAPAPEDAEAHAHEDHGDHGHHHHDAPHGGVLVSLGDHVAHLEVLHDPAAGQLTVYVLDGEAEQPLRLKDEALALRIEDADGVAMDLSLAAVANALTGETVGDSSQFAVRDPRLAGLTHFEGSFPAITVLGVTATDVAFHWPEEAE